MGHLCRQEEWGIALVTLKAAVQLASALPFIKLSLGRLVNTFVYTGLSLELRVSAWEQVLKTNSPLWLLLGFQTQRVKVSSRVLGACRDQQFLEESLLPGFFRRMETQGTGLRWSSGFWVSVVLTYLLASATMGFSASPRRFLPIERHWFYFSFLSLCAHLF